MSDDIFVSANNHQVDGDHYVTMDVQPWDVMQRVLSPAEFRGYLKGCVIKYAMRQGRKDISPMDGEKCKHYMAKLAEIDEVLF